MGWQKVRSEIFEKLGPVCARCGFSDIRALVIDHKKGNGNLERRKGSPFHRKPREMLLHLDDYQILCQNCNWIKRVENGEDNSLSRAAIQKREQQKREILWPSVPIDEPTDVRLRSDNLGISPVLAVIGMIAITVLLAVVLYLIVAGVLGG